MKKRFESCPRCGRKAKKVVFPSLTISIVVMIVTFGLLIKTSIINDSPI